MISKLLSIQTSSIKRFIRLQKGNKPGEKKNLDQTKKLAHSDDKIIKLSKKESEELKKVAEESKERSALAPKFSSQLEFKFDNIAQKAFEKIKQNTQIDLATNPLQTWEMMKNSIYETSIERNLEKTKNNKELKEKFDLLDIRKLDGLTWKQIKQQKEFFNAESFVNFENKIKPINPSCPMSRRSGVLAYKIGMTNVFDKWGHCIPLTVLQVDRCQVIRVKTKEVDGVDSLLLGCGEKSLNTVPKSLVGLYLKARVPPKMNLSEFTISPENQLPVGHMIGARHFTVGQFVDVKAKSKGKGFCGPMKRWGFKGLPASHGVSVAHRSHGSTGNHQDPGRVFKGKKMAGRMGNRYVIVRKLPIYKIDNDRSLIYVKGSVPGPSKRLIHISDSFYHWKDNKGKLNYPTFIENPKENYASVVSLEPSISDPTEKWLHENAILKQSEEETAV